MREIEREGAHNERNTERNTTRQGGKREEKKKKEKNSGVGANVDRKVLDKKNQPRKPNEIKNWKPSDINLADKREAKVVGAAWWWNLSGSLELYIILQQSAKVWPAFATHFISCQLAILVMAKVS